MPLVEVLVLFEACFGKTKKNDEEEVSGPLRPRPRPILLHPVYGYKLTPLTETQKLGCILTEDKSRPNSPIEHQHRKFPSISTTPPVVNPAQVDRGMLKGLIMCFFQRVINFGW